MLARWGSLGLVKVSALRVVGSPGVTRSALLVEQTAARRAAVFASRHFAQRPRPSKPSVLWTLLEKVGLSKCVWVRLSRRLKKYCYPWLCYSLPAALVLSLGDLLAQYRCEDCPLGRSLASCWDKERTAVYSVLGLLVVGPVLSRWNLFWYRKLRCRSAMSYILAKSLVDVLLLAPALLSLMAFLYDQTWERNLTNTPWEVYRERVLCRYLPAVRDVLLLNAATRPLVGMAACYLVPLSGRRLFRTLYELFVAWYVSHSFAKYRLRSPPPGPPPTPCSKKDGKVRSDIWKWPC